MSRRRSCPRRRGSHRRERGRLRHFRGDAAKAGGGLPPPGRGGEKQTSPHPPPLTRSELYATRSSVGLVPALSALPCGAKKKRVGISTGPSRIGLNTFGSV